MLILYRYVRICLLCSVTARAEAKNKVQAKPVVMDNTRMGLALGLNYGRGLDYVLVFKLCIINLNKYGTSALSL